MCASNAPARNSRISFWSPDGADEADFLLPPVERDTELNSLTALLTTSRFLAITGPEGIGKSHMLYWALANRVRLPKCLIRVHAGDVLADRLREVFHAKTSALPDLVRAVGDQQLVLAIDDVHVLSPTDHWPQLLTGLLRSCQHLRVIVTSIHRPDVYGLAELPLPLLTLPAYDETSIAEMRRSRAIRLWTSEYEKANGVQPRDGDIKRATEIVRAVDGLPLGIITSIQLPDRLEDVMGRMAGRVFATLADEEALALAILGQLQRTWPMDIAVLLLSPWMDNQKVERVVQHLVNVSAIQRYCGRNSKVSFRIMRHVRAHGHQFLIDRGLLDDAEQAFTEAMLRISRDAFESRASSEFTHYQEMFAIQFADLEIAWKQLMARNDCETALELVTNVWPYWHVSGNLARYREVMEETLAVSDRPSAHRVRGLNASGVMCHLHGEWNQAVARHRDAIGLAEEMQEPELMGLAWLGLGESGVFSGDDTLAEGSLLIAEQIYTDANIAQGLADLQFVLAVFYWNQLKFDLASKIAEASLRWQQSIGNLTGMATAHALAGRIRADIGDEHRAAFHLFHALELAEQAQDQIVLAETLEGLAKIAANQEKTALAARLLGAAARRRSNTNNPGWPSSFATLKETVRNIARELGPEFDVEFNRGRRLSWQSVLNQLTEISVSVSNDLPVVSVSASANETLQRLGLTMREREVLQMMAIGALDREIAEALQIGIRTVHSHVHRVIQKLGATTRTAAVASAWRMGLLE